MRLRIIYSTYKHFVAEIVLLVTHPKALIFTDWMKECYIPVEAMSIRGPAVTGGPTLDPAESN